MEGLEMVAAFLYALFAHVAIMVMNEKNKSFRDTEIAERHLLPTAHLISTESTPRPIVFWDPAEGSNPGQGLTLAP